jgi:hypothetical protein
MRPFSTVQSVGWMTVEMGRSWRPGIPAGLASVFVGSWAGLSLAPTAPACVPWVSTDRSLPTLRIMSVSSLMHP